jgi:protein O-mannosyl-transferase
MKKGLPIFIVLLITFLCFLPVLTAGFVDWDDPEHFFQNPVVLVLNPQTVIQAFSVTFYHSMIYIPLTSLSWAIERYFFGFNPFVFHLDNLLLHLAVVYLIFIFAKQLKLSLWTASFGALLFAVHPMHVESVAWLTERKDVLYAVFYMAALCVYMKYLQTGRRRDFLVTLILGLLSMLAKPMAFSLPFILWLLDWYSKRKVDTKLFLEKGWIFLYVIPITWITYQVSLHEPIRNKGEGIFIWIWSLVFYPTKFFMLRDYSPLYQIPPNASLSNPVFVAAVLIFVATGYAIWRFRRERLWVFAVGFYVLSVFFLLRFDRGDIAPVADRYMYLPSAGICLWLAYLFERAYTYHRHFVARLIKAGAYILIIYLSVLTFKQCWVWNNSVALWSKVVQTDPTVVEGQANLCAAFFSNGEYDRGLYACECALRLNSSNMSAFHNRGLIYTALGKYTEAHRDFDQAIRLNPGFRDNYLDLGGLFLITKNYVKAEEDFTQALKLDQNSYLAYSRRGLARTRLNESQKALADFNQALTLNPRHVETYLNRAVFYALQQKYELAIADFDHVLKLDPKNVAAASQRALAYSMLKDSN